MSITKHRLTLALLAVMFLPALAGLSITHAALAQASSIPAVKGFDEAGPSTGTGDNFTAAQWSTIARDGFKVFITDPINWSSECSDGNCTAPVSTCTLNSAAVRQIQYAYNNNVDYAVYTRNPNCLTAAINGLSPTLQAHLSFAILDIETDPSVPVTQSLINGVTGLGQTPVIYSYQGAWYSIMNNSTAYDSYALQNAQVPNWNARYPAAYPSGFPAITAMPYPYGGWTGTAPEIEQVQCCTDIQGPAGAINNSSDHVDLDAVNAAWLSELPHQA